MSSKPVFPNRIIKAFSWLLIFVSSGLAAASDRPLRWATPIQMRGVGSLYKVTDFLYRSEQPTEEGMKNLGKMGIKTIINLRVFHSDVDKIKKTGLLVEEVSVKPWHIEDEDVIRVLRIIKKRENGPFLMHCWRGADRLGLMVAMFRIVEQGWSKDEAIEEMLQGGYGFHAKWSNIIAYVKKVNVERIRKELDRVKTKTSKDGREKVLDGTLELPPDVYNGEVPAFARFEGPRNPTGPVWRIELTSPRWPG